MHINFLKIWSLFSIIYFLSACSVAKLEARLEANPQCKDVINPKTGALMPCPGSEKAFYKEVGLAPVKVEPLSNTAVKPSLGTSTLDAGAKIAVQNDCKPQIHKKTGGTLPCPAPE